MSIVNAVLNAVRSEPIRTILYPLLAILVGTLVARGTVDQSMGDIITAVIAAVLGIPAAEIARSKVSPAGKRQVATDQM
ncbi:phage holin [Nocardia sp. Marseille-Q1738]